MSSEVYYGCSVTLLVMSLCAAFASNFLCFSQSIAMGSIFTKNVVILPNICQSVKCSMLRGKEGLDDRNLCASPYVNLTLLYNYPAGVFPVPFQFDCAVKETQGRNGYVVFRSQLPRKCHSSVVVPISDTYVVELNSLQEMIVEGFGLLDAASAHRAPNFNQIMGTNGMRMASFVAYKFGDGSVPRYGGHIGAMGLVVGDQTHFLNPLAVEPKKMTHQLLGVRFKDQQNDEGGVGIQQGVDGWGNHEGFVACGEGCNRGEGADGQLMKVGAEEAAYGGGSGGATSEYESW